MTTPTPGQELQARLQAEASDLFDEISITVLDVIDPANRELARTLYVEGYMTGWAAGGMAVANGKQGSS